MITGQMIHEAFLATHSDAISTLWEGISIQARISYIKTAQALEVKSHQAKPDDIEYIFTLSAQDEGDDRSEVEQASDIDGLASLVLMLTAGDDEFEVIVIQDGVEVGHGYYLVAADESIKDSEFNPNATCGKAVGLLPLLNEKTLKYSKQA